MLKFDEALKILLKEVKPLGTKEIPVLRSLGRVLREDIVSPINIPPFDKSAMDGYAIRSADVRGASRKAPVEMKVIEDIPAGSVGDLRIARGTAARIMTGAPMPRGADAVVMVEDTEFDESSVRVYKAVEKGENRGKAGEDVKKGTRILAGGTVIDAATMGMIASTGKAKVRVSEKPKVVIISTGSEVMAPGKALEPGQIYDSNGYSLTGMAKERGADGKFLGIALDRPGSLEDKFMRSGLFDILVLSGGVSVGDFDIVKDNLADFGVEELFWKVLIKPGMPIFAGKYHDRFVFGLPGNPVSCMVTFELFIRPVIDVMLGKKEIGPRRGKAVLAKDAKLKPARRKFLRGSLKSTEGKPVVELYKKQASGILRSMIESDVLVDIPAGVTEVKAGREVDIVYMRC